MLNAAQRRAIDTYYNSNAPLKLEDPSTEGATFGTASGTFALKYNDGRGRYWVEYEWRFQGATTRVDPLVFSALNTNQYGGQRGLEGWDKHAIRAGYSFRNKTVPIKLTAGVDNLLDTTYFLQNSPMPGRSFVLGATIDWKKAF